MDKQVMIKKLTTILKKAKMNKNLREAIKEIIKALKKDDIELAFELSAVKSLIATKSAKTKNYAFVEDADYNEQVLGRDIYSILDEIHHELAVMVHRIPSGLTVVSLSGIQRHKSTRKHSILRLMEKERERIRKKYRRKR